MRTQKPPRILLHIAGLALIISCGTLLMRHNWSMAIALFIAGSIAMLFGQPWIPKSRKFISLNLTGSRSEPSPHE